MKIQAFGAGYNDGLRSQQGVNAISQPFGKTLETSHPLHRGLSGESGKDKISKKGASIEDRNTGMEAALMNSQSTEPLAGHPKLPDSLLEVSFCSKHNQGSFMEMSLKDHHHNKGVPGL